MHKWGKEILECVKAKVEAIGIDNFEGQNLDDLKDWTEIAKNIACFDKDYRIVEAMDKAEDEEEIMEMIERYEDYPGRRHYDNYRYKTSGKFAPRGKGSYMPRRGYEEPPYYHMMPYEMSVNEYKMYSPEQLRDLDRKNGKLYYTPMVENKVVNSRYDNARKWYSESKQLHKGNTPEDNTENMKNLEKILNIIAEDVKEYMPNMSPSEKSLTKQKIEGISKSIQ